MDQGSYSRPDGRGHPTMTAQSARDPNYKVNVNRQKTRKWVEAKSQNYDGDDWGADEYDDEDEEPELPPVPTTTTLPSQKGNETPRAHAENVPHLHIQTQQQPAQPPGQQPQANVAPTAPEPSNAGSSVTTAAGQMVSPMSGTVPQSASSTYPLSPRSPPDSLPSTTPQAATGKPPAFIRPSDIYRRMEEEREKERLSSDSARPSLDQLTKERSASSSKLSTDNTSQSSAQQPPAQFDYAKQYQNLSPITETQASSPATNQATTPSRERGGVLEAAARELDGKRASTSPKLPDLARMSAFGPDLFSTGGFMSEPSPKREPIKEEAPEPATVDTRSVDKVPEEPATPKASAATQEPAVQPAPIQEQKDASNSSAAAETPTEDKETVDPVQEPAQDDAKPSVARDSHVSAAKSSSTTSRPDITPTEPLNLRKQDPYVPDFEPPPVQRQDTYGTDTSSPAKESDALRDEIIRSLSPGRPTASDSKSGDLERQDTDQSTRNRARDSNYTLKDYDSYWADSGDTPDVPSGRDEAPQSKAPVMETVHEDANANEAVKTAEDAPRSSLEASKDEAHVPTTTEAELPQQEAHSAQPIPTISVPESESQPVQEPSLTEKRRRRFSWETEDEPEEVAPPAQDKPEDAPVAPEAPSAAATGLPEQQREASPVRSEPASPQLATVASPTAPVAERTSMNSQEEARLSLADEKNLDKTTSSPISTPPQESHPALAHPDMPSPVSAMPAPSSSPRAPGAPTMSFKEIMDMNSSSDRIARFNDTRVSYATMDTGLDRWLASMYTEHPEHLSKNLASPRPANNAGAGTTGATAGQPGQQPQTQQPYYQQYLNASAPSPTSSPSGGRSRLGGLAMPSSGASSGFGHSSNQIGTKSKEFMHSAGKMGKGLLSKGKNKLRGSGDKGETPTPPSPVQAKVKAERRSSWALSLGGKLRTESPKEQTPTDSPAFGVSRSSLTPAPQLPEPEPLSPLAGDASSDKSAPWAQQQPSQTEHVENAPRTLSSNVPATTIPNHHTASHQSSSNQARTHIQVASPSSHAHLSPALRTPEDSGVAFATQDQKSTADEAPKRQSSFVGLPPIRRTSTFAIASKVKRATERFPLDDDDERGPVRPAETISEHPLPEREPQPTHETAHPLQPREQRPVHQQPVPQGNLSEVNLKKDEPTVTQQEVGSQSSEHLPTQPAGQPVSQPVLVNPRLATSGPWKLEESHLSEPLHPVTRNRPSPSSSPQMYYGFDKETGTGMNAMMPPPQLPPQNIRPRNPDIPPSSAERYPGLFAPRPGEEPQQWNNGDPDQLYRNDIVNPRRSNEYFIPGVGPPSDDRGRPQRTSGFFKDIGDKITRATSRERRSSMADQRPSMTDHRPPASAFKSDDASDWSFGAEETQAKKKRRSFIPAMMHRSSMDSGSQRQSFSGIQRSNTDMNLASDMDMPKERKKSFFGASMSGLVSRKDAAANQSTSSFDHDGAGASREHLDNETTPKKKRFSGIAKVFQRNKDDQSSDAQPSPGYDNTAQRRGSGFLAGLHGPGRKRSATAGSFDMPPPPVPTDDSGRGSRRNSISDMLSGFMGRHAGSRPSSRGVQQLPPQQAQRPTPDFNSYSNIPPPPRQVHQDDLPSQRQGFPSENRQSFDRSIDHEPPPKLQLQHHHQPPSTAEDAATEDDLHIGESSSQEAAIDAPEPPFAGNKAGEEINRPGSSSTITPKEAPKGDDVVTERPQSGSMSNLPLAGGSDSEIWRPTPAVASSPKREPTKDVHMRDAASAEPPADAIVSGDESDGVSAVRPSVSSQVTDSEVSRQVTNESQDSQDKPLPPIHPEQQHAQRPPNAVRTPQAGGQFIPPQSGVGDAMRDTTNPRFSPSPHQQWPQPGPNQWEHSQGRSPMQGIPPSLGGPPPNVTGYRQPVRMSTDSSGFNVPPRQSLSSNQGSSYYGQPVSASEQPTAQGSKWKDLRSRMSGQMAGLVQNQNKADKPEKVEKTEKPEKSDRLSGGKLLGAFKRMSKQQGPSGAQQQAAMQPIASHQQPAQGAQPSWRAPQGAAEEFPPRQQFPQQQLPQQQPMNASQFHQPARQPQPMNVSQFHQPARQPNYQQQPQGFTEPQYAAVPIPQGYTAVYGEGSQVPTAYNVGRAGYQQPPHGYMNYNQQQPGHGSQLPHRYEPSPLMQQNSTMHQQISPPASEQLVSPTSDQSGRSAYGRTEPSPPTSHQAPSVQPQDSRNSLGPQFLSSGMSQISHDSTTQRPSPQASDAGQAQQSPGSDDDAQRRVSAASPPPAEPNVVVASDPSSAAASNKASPQPAHASATHLTAHSTGDSKGGVSDMSRSSSANGATPAATVELENTEEARKRTMRIASQEEKIAYDPAENEPQMSATSYPGQEWNPYGEPGYGDWREE